VEDWVTQPMAIMGTATDLNLQQFVLAIAPGPPGESAQFTEVGSGASPVDNGVLATWSVLPTDGSYTLRLRVDDAGGNRTDVLRLVRVDTSPPAPPTGLTGNVRDDDAELSWSPSVSTDVTGYLVLRNGARLTTSPRPGTSFDDPALDDGTYEYVVIAVDGAGLESEPSLPVRLTVDTVPPQVALHRPLTSARVAGVVEHFGSRLRCCLSPAPRGRRHQGHRRLGGGHRRDRQLAPEPAHRLAGASHRVDRQRHLESQPRARLGGLPALPQRPAGQRRGHGAR
jgi:hypothetical protein